MPSRISAALRELAAALEEAEGDEVSAPATSRPPSRPPSPAASAASTSSTMRKVLGEFVRVPTTSSSSTARSGPKARAEACKEEAGARPSKEEQQRVTGSTVAYHNNIRTYIVVANPRQPDRIGCVQGPGGETWRKLEASLPGGRLSGSAVRLRENRQHAQQIWEAAHEGIQMPTLLL